MKELKYSEIVARNRELGGALAGADYRIALLSNVVMYQLGDLLEFQLRQNGINAQVTLGDYDNIVQDSQRFKGFDAVVIFWEIANLVDGLHAKADVLDSQKVSALVERVEGEIALVLENLKTVPLVLFNRFSPLIFVSDDLRPGPLTSIASRLNCVLEEHVSAGQFIVATDNILATVGLNDATDFRQFLSSKALYSVNFLKRYVEHIDPVFRAATGKVRKVLVLDCDNTLWGGILGEDGESQLHMSDATRQGRAFHEMQNLVKGLKQKGVLLALCSKNNPEDVDRVLASHPDMVLRDPDFVAKKVNWMDKATNISALAQELNLGLDSFVFLDDSEFELGLVEKELPQVRCFKVPTTLSDYPQLIRRISREFFTLSSTAEDATKTEMYRQEQERKKFTEKFLSIDDYLQSLGLHIRIAWDTSISVARAAQLSQKTNQFNLTTRRYTEADIGKMLADPTYLLSTLSVSDRFGDYGIVGLAIIQRDSTTPTATIDTLLMSCRVLGRNIETVFFDHLFQKLSASGIKKLYAEYIRTAKNDQVASFYDSLGFKSSDNQSDLRKYEIQISDYKSSSINYVEVSDAI